MQKHSIAEALYLSFFSGSLYRDVAVRWKGFCLIYLLAVLAVCTIPFALRIQADLRDWLAEEAPPCIKQLPHITIEKGVLSIDAPVPYRIMNVRTGEPVIIIDTSGQVTSLEGTKAYALATKTSLIVRFNGRLTQTYTFSDMSSETVRIDNTNAYEFIDAFTGMFPVVIYPFLLFLSYLVWLAEALVYSVAGGVYARRLSLPLNFKAVFRISVVALTPSLLLGAVLMILGTSVPNWWLISMILSMGYLLFGIRSNIKSSPLERSDEKNPGH